MSVAIHSHNRTTPYKKIRELIENKDLWLRIVRHVQKKVLTDGLTEREQITSCSTNFTVLTALYFTPAKTCANLEILFFNTLYRIPKSPGFKASFPHHFVHNILSGLPLLKYNEEKARDPGAVFDAQAARDSGTKHAEEFAEKVERSGDLEVFNYNSTVINALEKEMKTNSHRISRRCTFLYQVLISQPSSLNIPIAGSEESIANAKLAVDHAFFFEQYYSEQSGKVFVRLLQGWIEHFSLLDHCTFMKFGDGDEGCFDEQKLADFFHNFKDLYSCHRITDTYENFRCFQKACFGVYGNVFPLKFFRNGEGIYTGKCVKYLSTRTDPQTLMANIDTAIAEFIEVV